MLNRPLLVSDNLGHDGLGQAIAGDKLSTLVAHFRQPDLPGGVDIRDACEVDAFGRRDSGKSRGRAVGFRPH